MSTSLGGNGGPAPVAGKAADIRALHRHLVSARDEKILQVVAMVDALPHRGQADALIAPLRPRLAELQPRRPLHFGRLLFMPLNPVVIPGPKWRRDSLAVPRTALPCIVRQVGEMAPDLVDDITRQIDGGMADDRLLLLRVGPKLWPQAARLLGQAPPPDDWESATGLSQADHGAIRRTIVLVLEHAVVIATQMDADEPDADAIGQILQQAALSSAEALSTLITVLLHWVPAAAPLVMSATSAHASPAGVAGRVASERAVEFVLDALDSDQLANNDGPAGLDRLRRTVALLDGLADQSGDRPSRAARISATRARIDAACRERFADVLQNDVLKRIGGTPAAVADALGESGMPGTGAGRGAGRGAMDAEAVGLLEASARQLRNFEQVARRVNRSDHYDKLLRDTAALLAPVAGEDEFARIDRLRLAEILLGPETALSMLGPMPAAGLPLKFGP